MTLAIIVIAKQAQFVRDVTTPAGFVFLRTLPNNMHIIGLKSETKVELFGPQDKFLRAPFCHKRIVQVSGTCTYKPLPDWLRAF